MINDETNGAVPEDTQSQNGSNPPPTKKQSSAFDDLVRTLTDEDLTNPAVGKLLLDHKDRLEIENSELKKYRERFYDADKDRAVLQKDEKETKKIKIVIETLSTVCLIVGGVVVAQISTLWSHQPWGWIALCGGLLLIAGGIVAKVVRI